MSNISSFLIILFFANSGFTATPLPKKTPAATYDNLSWDEKPNSNTLSEISEDKGGLKILWWNTACNTIQSGLTQKGKPGLFDNLKILSNDKNSPPIIILGEYCHKNFNSKVLKELKITYENTYHLIKSNPKYKIDNGLLILSKFPFEVVEKKLIGVSDYETQISDKHRTYLLIKMHWEDHDIYISPLHLINPWRKLINELSLTEFMLKIFGSDNDNYRQGELFVKELKKDVPENSPVLLIGDFNSAKAFMGIKNMATFNLFQQNFIYLENDKPTFPSLTAKSLNSKFPTSIIDHAFIGGSLTGNSLVLPLKGSDHYPLWITISKTN